MIINWETEALQPLFLFQPRKAHQEKQNPVYGGNGRGKSNQGQAGIGKRRHEQSDGNAHEKGGADALYHDGEAVSAAVEVADAGKQDAGQDAFCGKALQISGALGDDLHIGGEEGGEEAAAEKAGEKDENTERTTGEHGGEKSLPGPVLFAGTDVLCNEGGQTLHDGRRDQHDEGYDFLSDAVPGGRHEAHVVDDGVDDQKGDLHHGFLNGDGNAHVQDPLQLSGIKSALLQRKADGKVLFLKDCKRDNNGDKLRQHGGDGRARHIHVEHADQKKIPYDVHHAGDAHKEKRKVGVSYPAQDAADHVIGDDDQNASGADADVEHGFVKGFGGNLQDACQRPGEDFQKDGERDAHNRKQQNRRSDGVARLLRFLFSDVLSDGDGGPHGQAGDDEGDHLHERASGAHRRDARRVAEPADHQQIHCTIGGLQDQGAEDGEGEADEGGENGPLREGK